MSINMPTLGDLVQPSNGGTKGWLYQQRGAGMTAEDMISERDESSGSSGSTTPRRAVTPQQQQGSPSPSGTGVHEDAPIVTGQMVIAWKDEAMERIDQVFRDHTAHIEGSVEGLGHLGYGFEEPEEKAANRSKLYAVLERLDAMHEKDGDDLFDLAQWVRLISEAFSLEERQFERELKQMADLETDKVSASLQQAQDLKQRMADISLSLVATAQSEHKLLRSKLKEQYFSFESRLSMLISNLEEEGIKRRQLSMTNVMLKQKVMVLQMKNALSKKKQQEEEQEDASGMSRQHLNDLLAHRELEMAQLTDRLQEQQAELEKLRTFKVNADAELMLARDQLKSFCQYELELEKGRQRQMVLDTTRKALDRDPYDEIDVHDDPQGHPLTCERVDEEEIFPSALLAMPREITALYKILDDYSDRLKAAQQGQGTGKRAGEDLEPAFESVTKEQWDAVQEELKKASRFSAQAKETINGLKAELSNASAEANESAVKDYRTGVGIVTEKICTQRNFHHNVVDSIVGVGFSALSKAEADLLLQSSNKIDGGIHVAETVCETLERYLRECWKNTGIKDMADSIHAVTLQNSRGTSEKFSHLARMHRLRSSINAIPKGSHSKWVDDLLARYEERKRRWEIRKASLWQDRADALVKCMKSVLHVITLNIGISLPRESEENILSAMQLNCIGRGNAFWPRSPAVTEVQRIHPRVKTAQPSTFRGSSSPFSVTRLPLHRMPSGGTNVEGPESFQHSSRRDSRDVYNVSPSGLDTRRRDDGMRQAAAPQPKSFRHSRRDSKDVYNVSPDPDIMPLKGQDLQIPADGYMPRGVRTAGGGMGLGLGSKRRSAGRSAFSHGARRSVTRESVAGGHGFSPREMGEDAHLGMYPLYRDSPSPDCEDDGGDAELVSNHRNGIVQKEKSSSRSRQSQSGAVIGCSQSPQPHVAGSRQQSRSGTRTAAGNGAHAALTIGSSGLQTKQGLPLQSSISFFDEISPSEPWASYETPDFEYRDLREISALASETGGASQGSLSKIKVHVSDAPAPEKFTPHPPTVPRR